MICPDCKLETCFCKAKKQKQAQYQDNELLKQGVKIAKKIIKKELTATEKLRLRRERNNSHSRGR
ncbi:hypothetical protein SPONN_2282 [uncultured Candidatus Thioglobus sp.]|nr:hypothetical protein SPONN_2282 [uncultured Candidatus Thioglobus sp.]SMN00115.1 hypothetical protein SPONL_1085 [uncultured Candidatus Thioglobus sp.]